MCDILFRKKKKVVLTKITINILNRYSGKKIFTPEA